MLDFRDYLEPRKSGGFDAIDFGEHGKLSIQAGSYLYSEPRADVSKWTYTQWEIGVLPGLGLLPEGCPYRLEDECSGNVSPNGNTVYPYMDFYKVQVIFNWYVEQYGEPVSKRVS